MWLSNRSARGVQVRGSTSCIRDLDRRLPGTASGADGMYATIWLPRTFAAVTTYASVDYPSRHGRSGVQLTFESRDLTAAREDGTTCGNGMPGEWGAEISPVESRRARARVPRSSTPAISGADWGGQRLRQTLCNLKGPGLQTRAIGSSSLWLLRDS